MKNPNESTILIDVDYNPISNQANDIGNEMNNNYKENIPSTIHQPTNQETSQTNTTTMEFQECLKDKKSPYPYVDKIPEIKIKNENYFESWESIENYLKSLNKIDDIKDAKFSTCEECNVGKNNYFCNNKECHRGNMCNNCYKDCESKGHELINLIEMKKVIDNYIEKIRKIISVNFILLEYKKDDDGIEKKSRSYELFDEDKINFKIGEKPMDYTNDIELIKRIIEHHYTNYIHYNNIIECFNYMIKKYQLIFLTYKIKKNENKIKIFGTYFVEKNKDSCQIIYNDKRSKLTEFINLKKSEKDNVQIILIDINKIKNLKEMFDDCSSLISIDDISILNTTEIISLKRMFYGCKNLKSLPDISKWTTMNVNDMSNMFGGCSSLISLPDISNWNTENVTSMKSIFHGCKNLKSLPDISKWTTMNVNDMSNMFGGCSSLISLPDISEWNVSNVTDMENMFLGCKSLKSMPDISKWETYYLENVKNMFEGCSSLTALPDISKWKTDNLLYCDNIIEGCSSLSSLPDISKWNKIE